MIYQDEIVGLIENCQEEYEDYKEFAKDNGIIALTEEEYVRRILSSLYNDIREQARGLIESNMYQLQVLKRINNK